MVDWYDQWLAELIAFFQSANKQSARATVSSAEASKTPAGGGHVSFDQS
jgi:hypothetical protein